MDNGGFEIDHVFVAVRHRAPELAELLRAGFAEGPPNVHVGQGTACRRVFFENGYLEFLWLEDSNEASVSPVDRTGLAERTQCVGGVSRLGVALRSRSVAGTGPELPIRTWPYRPAYLPAGTSIPVAANADKLREPLLFFIPDGFGSGRPSAGHPNGARRMTELEIMLPSDVRLSPELAWLDTVPGVRVMSGEAELLSVEIDHGVQGQVASLAPSAPLRVNW